MEPGFITFLGYCGLLNIVFLMIWLIAILVARNNIINLHSKIFTIDEVEILPIHYKLMGIYKLMNVLFFITPWLVLSFIL